MNSIVILGNFMNLYGSFMNSYGYNYKNNLITSKHNYRGIHQLKFSLTNFTDFILYSSHNVSHIFLNLKFLEKKKGKEKRKKYAELNISNFCRF